MSCSCRAAPLRSFIRGLAQVHKLDSSSSFRFVADTGVVSPRRIIAARSTRAFHGTRRLGQDAAAEASTPQNESRQESAVDSSSAKESGSTSAAGSDQANPKPAKKSKSKPKSTKPKTTKPKTSRAANATRKPQKDTEGEEGSEEAPARPRKSRQTPDDAADKPPRKPRLAKGSKPTKPKDNKMRDIADSILAHRRADESKTSEDVDADKPRWLVQKEALKKKFPNGWAPPKRLSPDALAGIRALNAQFPDVYNVPTLSAHFKVSAENIRRILKSKWQPSQDEEEDRERRWHNRGKSIWEAKAALGIKPPRKWRDMGITRDPEYHARRQHGIQREKEIDEEEKEAYKNWRQQFNSKKGGIV